MNVLAALWEKRWWARSDDFLTGESNLAPDCEISTNRSFGQWWEALSICVYANA